jgi:hypothetical protein
MIEFADAVLGIVDVVILAIVEQVTGGIVRVSPQWA